MGKLLEALKRRMAEIEKKRQGPAPDIVTDPAAALNFQKQLMDAAYLESHIAVGIVARLAQMSNEQQDQFYDSCIQENKKASYTKERFHSDLEGSSVFLLDSNSFGQDWEKTISQFEQLISEEENEALARQVEELKIPSDPNYPKDLKYTNPYKDAITQQRNLIKEDDPDAAKKKAILDQADEVLMSGSVDTLNYLQRQYSGFENPKVAALDTQMDMVTDLQTVNFLDHTLENGRYKDKFPTRSGNGLQRRYHCRVIDPASSTLTDEDVRDLKNTQLELSNETLNPVLAVMEKMDQIGVEKFQNNFTAQQGQDEDGNIKIVFKGEQGEKNYAFWPIVTAKHKLGEALKAGNYAEAEQALQDYNHAKLLTDGIMKDVQVGSPLFGGNVESTRPGTEARPNVVPLEYLEDTVGHNKANGLFCLYAYCKSYNQKPEDVLKNPVRSLVKASDEFRHERMLSGTRHTGRKLVKAFDNNSSMMIDQHFDNQIRSLGHGLDAVAAMANSKEESERITGLGQVAAGAAMYDIRKEQKVWIDISKMDAQKAGVIYTHAALLPDEDFDLVQIGQKLSAPDWRHQLSTDALITRLKNEGKLDFNRLATHVDEIMADADRQFEINPEAVDDTNYHPAFLMKAALTAYKKVLKQATPEEQETEGYRALRNKVKEMQNQLWVKSFELGDVDTAVKTMDQQIDILARRKTGFMMKKTNSAEHQRMMHRLITVKYKIKQLQGEELPELNDRQKQNLKKLDLAQELQKARKETYEYYRLKTENGSKDSFTYTDGVNRANAASSVLNCLALIEKTMNLSSPVRQAQEELQKTICSNRDGAQRERANVSQSAAKMIYLLHIGYKNKSMEEQQHLLEPQQMNAAIANIQASPVFQTMMRQEGHKKIADYLTEGGGKFTDACIKAQNVIKARNGEPVRDPADMTKPEKERMWEEHQIPNGLQP